MTQIDPAVFEALVAAHPDDLDEVSGSLLDDGRQVARLGKLVRVATWDDRTATEYPSVAKAREAFKDAAS